MASNITARVLLDSINPDGCRLTTFVIRYPRFIIAEINTHRALSKNTSSSRAIPIAKVIRQVWNDPACPVSWGQNQKGMQAGAELEGWKRWLVTQAWRFARIPAIGAAWALMKLGAHKQVANRILEPWVWTETIISGTEWANMLTLRNDPAAQPEFQALARAIANAYYDSTPRILDYGEWHTPFADYLQLDNVTVQSHGVLIPFKLAVAAGRCARVSYMTHDGKLDPEADVSLFMRLIGSGHWSPLEHVAEAIPDNERSGNFTGWRQLRKLYAHENITEFTWPRN